VKNKITDLNNHLFAQLERLSDESLTPEQIEKECQRAEAIVSVSEQIAKAADLQLKAATLVANHGDRFRAPLAMLAGPSE
jgi:Asp-tRNA(Asn)/Glu-tRNA(Gln) amidotransferase C subunit